MQAKISNTEPRIFCWHEVNFIWFFFFLDILRFELVTTGTNCPGWLQTAIILISTSWVPTVNWTKACWTDMHAQIDKETEMLDWKQHMDGSVPQHMLYWEGNSLEAFPSKRVWAHSCLQTRNRYRKLVGEVQEGRVNSQEGNWQEYLQSSLCHSWDNGVFLWDWVGNF
jgi:hypothetical protein